MKASVRIVAVLVSASLFATSVRADDPGEPGIAIIRRPGAPAPFSGVLFSDSVYATQRARQELLVEKLTLEHRFELDSLRVKMQLATSTTTHALVAERRSSKEKQIEASRRFDASQDELKMTKSALRNAEERGPWIFGVGIVVGALAMFGSAVAIHYAATGELPWNR